MINPKTSFFNRISILALLLLCCNYSSFGQRKGSGYEVIGGHPTNFEFCVGEPIAIEYDSKLFGFAKRVELKGYGSIIFAFQPSSSPNTNRIDFVLPKTAQSNDLVITDAKGSTLFTINKLVIRNPPVSFTTAPPPHCANSVISLKPNPIGGTFIVTNPQWHTFYSTDTLSGNSFNAGKKSWGPTHFQSKKINLQYDYLPTYSDGSSCPAISTKKVTKTINVYDNRLDKVSFTPVHRSAGKVRPSLDHLLSPSGVPTVIPSTRPDISCAGGTTPCYPHRFYNSFIDSKNGVFDALAANNINIIKLSFDNNGCKGQGAGSLSVIGLPVIPSSIPSLPDSLCPQAGRVLFSRNPSLTYHDTVISGDRYIYNELLKVTTKNPASQTAVKLTQTSLLGHEILELLPRNIASFPYLVIQLHYINRILPNSSIPIVDTFVVTDTIVMTGSPAPAIIAGLDPTYCTNDPSNVIRFSPTIGYNSFSVEVHDNQGYNIPSNLGTGNIFDPKTQFNLSPSGITVGEARISYKYDYHGCQDSVTALTDIHRPTPPSFSGLQSSYTTTDPPDTIRSNNTINSLNYCNFSGTCIASTNDSSAVFNPGLAGLGSTTVHYSYADSLGCTSKDSAKVLIKTGNSSPPADNITFSNNNNQASGLNEACFGTTVSFDYDDLPSAPASIVLVSKRGAMSSGGIITAPNLTISNTSTGTNTGVKGKVSFTIPKGAASGPVIFRDATGASMDTFASIILHNPDVDFMPLVSPICATNTAVPLFGYPSGGTFNTMYIQGSGSINPINNNTLDATALQWGNAHKGSLIARIYYSFTPRYSNGTVCAKEISTRKDLTIYDNRLTQVQFATLTQQDALAGNKALSIDANMNTIVTNTTPSIMCNSVTGNPLPCNYPFKFSGAFVNQQNEFLSPIAAPHNLVHLTFNNHGCTGHAIGFIDILGRLNINNLPDTICASSSTQFSSDSSLIFVDTSITASNGDVRRTIQNQLLGTYTTNPAHQIAIIPNSTIPGQETFVFTPSILSNASRVEVNMKYQNLTTVTSTNNIDTILADNFTVTQTVDIVAGGVSLSIGNLKTTYCASDEVDTLFPSLGFLGASANTVYLEYNSNRIDLPDYLFDPMAIYDSFVPNGGIDPRIKVTYNGSYYGCPNQIDKTFTITQPLNPNYTSNSPYCKSDAPDTLQTPFLPPNVSGRFGLAAGINTTSGVFSPNSAAIGMNFITYIQTDINGCSYKYLDSIDVVSGPVIELTLDGKTTPDPFCYDENNIPINTNVTSQYTMNSPVYSGEGVTGTNFDPSDLYARNIDSSFVAIAISDLNGCTGFDTVFVRIDSPPVLNIDTVFNGVAGNYGPNGNYVSEHSICRSANRFLMNPIPNYGLSDNITGYGVVKNGNNFDYDANQVPRSIEADTVIYYYTSIFGCSNTDTAIIKLDLTPTVKILNAPANDVCINASSIQLTGVPTATSISEGYFTISNSTGTGIDSLTGMFDPALAGLGQHDITYHYSGISGCPSQSTVQIKVTPVTTTSYANLQTTYCNSDPASLLVSTNSPLGSYKFSGQLIIAGTDSINPRLVTALAPTSALSTVYYEYTAINGCTAYDSTTVTILPTPNVGIYGLDSNYCSNGDATYFSMLPAGAGGELISPDSTFTIVANSIRIRPKLGQVGYNTFRYAFSDGNGCADTVTATTYIKAITLPSISGLVDFYCEVPDTFPISGTPSGGYFRGSGIDSLPGGQWYFIPSRAGSGDNFIQYYTIGSLPGQPLVCPTDTIKKVRVSPDLKPTLFSPIADTSGFCSNDSLMRLIYDPIGPSVTHRFSNNSNAIVFANYTRHDTIGYNPDTVVTIVDSTHHFDPSSATKVVNYVNYVVEDNITHCKDSVLLSFVVYQFEKIDFKIDSSFCEHDDSVLLIATPITNGVFTRDGDTIKPYKKGAPLYFDPVNTSGIPITSTIQDTLVYSYQNQACTDQVTHIIDIHPVLEISYWTDSTHNTYCLGGDTVWLHTTDTGGIFSGTGIRAGSNFFIPDLAEAGLHPILFEFTDTLTGCYSKYLDTINVYGVPNLEFEVEGGCQGDDITFTPNNAVLNLNNLFQNNYVDSITSILWQVSDSVVISATGKRDSISPITYQYPSPGIYFTKLFVTNQTHCIDSQTVRIVISPKVTNYPYVQDFESDNGNWFAESRDSSHQLLWNWGIDSNSIVGGHSDKSNHIWATQTDSAYKGGEDAWVYSPCFDLTHLNRPMISLDWWSDVREADGTVIEYQRKDGSWAPLGQFNRGKNWFDASYIGSNPGDQDAIALAGTGWTQPIGWSSISNAWKNGRYKLDDVMGSNKMVRMRFSFASLNLPFGRSYDGFAFDNVVVRSRTRNVLLETMADDLYTNMESISNKTYNLVYHTNLNKDVTMLEYHTKSINPTDLFYFNNPALGRTRAYEYGGSPIGRSYINGYDSTKIYITNRLTNADFEEDMLADAMFSITIDTFIHSNNNFRVVARTTAKKDMPHANYRIYTVISEDFLTYSAGSGYTSQLHSVVRENDQFHLDPTVNSKQIFPKNWTSGETIPIDFNWNHANYNFINYRPNHFQAVVFIQNIDTKEVFQVATTRDVSGYWVGVEPIQAEVELNEIQNMNLFPNPAHDYFNLAFDQALKQDYQWKLVNVQGITIKEGQVTEGNDQVTIDGLNCPAGTYILLLYNDKVFVQRRVVLGRP